MKNFLALAGLTILATGCPGTTKCDSGDTACEDTGGGSGTPLLWDVGGACAAGVCTWYADSDGTIGSVELYLSETGDKASTNIWEEVHTAFSYVGPSSHGGDEFAIDLNLVDDYTQQVDNQSTLFDLNSAEISNQLTVLFMMYDANDAYADCATYGHDPSYFSSMCTNNWN